MDILVYDENWRVRATVTRNGRQCDLNILESANINSSECWRCEHNDLMFWISKCLNCKCYNKYTDIFCDGRTDEMMELNQKHEKNKLVTQQKIFN